MNKKAWVSQVASQVAKYGADKASWYVSWHEPDGSRKTKSCGPGSKGKMAADKLADRTHAELLTGTYKSNKNKSWEDFWAEYEDKILKSSPANSAATARLSIEIFVRIANPKKIGSITTNTVDGFISKRKAETNKAGKPISASTVNRDLRYVRSVLKTAKKWRYIDEVPEFGFLAKPDKLPTYVAADEFQSIYNAVEFATAPAEIPNVNLADWWKGILVVGYMTGWRLGQLLDLKWVDIDLKAGTAVTMADAVGNKGNRDQKVPLHPIVVEHLERITGSGCENVFPWDYGRRRIWSEFEKIQDAAKMPDGSALPKGGKGGKRFGFHDLRRGFATLNAGIDVFRLQALMQHKSLETTRLYVNMGKSLQATVEGLYVPAGLQTRSRTDVEQNAKSRDVE
jgi:integrase